MEQRYDSWSASRLKQNLKKKNKKKIKKKNSDYRVQSHHIYHIQVQELTSQWRQILHFPLTITEVILSKLPSLWTDINLNFLEMCL